MTLQELWCLIVRALESIVQFPLLKAIFAGVGWLLFHLFGGLTTAVGTLITLWIADFIFGIWHARLLTNVKITSRRARHGFVKLIIYMIPMCVAHQFGKIDELVNLAVGIQAAMIATEGYSVIEHFQFICKAKGIDIPIIDSLIKMIQGKIEEVTGSGVPQRRRGEANHKIKNAPEGKDCGGGRDE